MSAESDAVVYFCVRKVGELRRDDGWMGKHTWIAPPPLPEELKKSLWRPNKSAAQSIMRTSSSVHAGLEAHYDKYEK